MLGRTWKRRSGRRRDGMSSRVFGLFAGVVGRGRRSSGGTRSTAGERRRASASRRSRSARRRAGRSAVRVWNTRRLAVVASVVALAGALGYTLARAQRWAEISDRFAVSRVEVKGNELMTAEEVVALSGVTPGESVLAIDIEEVEAALARSPRIASARAYGLLPDRVLIRVEETRPFAFLSTRDGLVELAGDGSVLPPVARTPAMDLPVITGIDYDAGVENASTDARVAGALEFLLDAREVSAGLLDEISEVRIAPELGLVTYTVADGAEIRLGFGALDTNGLRRLWAVLQDLRARGARAETIDMRFADQVIVKLRRQPGGGRV